MSIQQFKIGRCLLASLCMALVSLGSAPVVVAGENGNSATSIINWETEGNGRCSDYFKNATVEEATVNIGGTSATAIGNYNPLDPDPDPADATRAYMDDEVVTVTMSSDLTTINRFDATTRINAVILKNSRDVAVFIEPIGGVVASLDYKYAPPLDGTTITSVSFCYGVSYDIPEVALEPMPACTIDSSGTDPNSDADGCESGENFECDFRLTGCDSDGENCSGLEVDCCSCDGPAVACDPTLPVGIGNPDACNDLAIKTFNQVLFGLNGKVVCFMTDSGELCYKK